MRKVGVLVVVTMLAGIGIRLFHLSGPPLDHHWLRQYDTAAMARHFVSPDSSILEPQVNWGGAESGLVESEFPIYQYLVGFIARHTGHLETVGRLVSIFFYLLAAWVLYLFGRDEFDRRVGLVAVVIYTILPLSWFFTRSIQPDAMAAFASLAAVHFWSRWCRHRGLTNVLVGGSALVLACLIKPTNLCLGLPIAFAAIRGLRARVLLSPQVWFLGMATLGAVYAWYSHARHLGEISGNTLYGAYPFPNWPTDINAHVHRLLVARFVEFAATPIVFVFMVVGLLSIRSGRGLVTLIWFASYLAPAFAISEQFREHDYYLLPLLFPIAVFAAQGLVRLHEASIIGPRLGALIALCAILYSATFAPLWYPRESWFHARVAFGNRVASLTDGDDRLITVKAPTRRANWYQKTLPDGTRLDYEPVDLYLADRTGFCIDSTMLGIDLIERLRALGATHLSYFVSPRWSLALPAEPEIAAELGRRYRLLYKGPDGALFDLRRAPEPAGGSPESGQNAPRPDEPTERR